VTPAGHATLAALASVEAQRNPARSAERRAACHLHTALTVPPARSLASAHAAIASFGDKVTQQAAAELLDRLTAQTTAATAAAVSTEGTS
jgi:hypothetical protein